MEYHDEHVQRVIDQMAALLREAVERRSEGHVAQAHELAERAVGLAIDTDPRYVLGMPPQGLRAFLEMENLDDRVLLLIAQAFDAEAMALEDRGEIVSGVVRREQATQIRNLVGPDHAN